MESHQKTYSSPDKYLYMIYARQVYRNLKGLLKRPNNHEWHFTPGLPSELPLEELQRVSKALLNADPVGIKHMHLSGWKEAGAYLVKFQSSDGREESAIFKNAVYSEDHIPGLSGLPVRPGPPEYAIAEYQKEAKLPFLPETYYIKEVVPGEHYLYLFEDLLCRYTSVRTAINRVKLSETLSDFHKQLEVPFSNMPNDHLIDYGKFFSKSSLDYAKTSLEQYASRKPGPILDRILGLWPRIEAQHQDCRFHNVQPVGPVHGDYNSTNVYVNLKKHSDFKVIDWEWAGFGYPQIDLVSLLKSQDTRIEQVVVNAFAKKNRYLSYPQHLYIYYWCQMERSLIDGAYVAQQDMGTNNTTLMDLRRFVESSLNQAIRSLEQLSSMDGIL